MRGRSLSIDKDNSKPTSSLSSSEKLQAHLPLTSYLRVGTGVEDITSCSIECKWSDLEISFSIETNLKN